MVIDPWNINGQQCFSLTCEGEWEKGEKKGEQEGGENRNLYLMVVFYIKKRKKCKSSTSIPQQQTYHIYKLY